MTFAGQTAVVTGATGGIGDEIARELAAAGAMVHGLGLVHATEPDTERLRWHRVDFADDAAVTGFAAALADVTDGLDILVHCAGIHSTGPVAATPVDEFERQWRINTRAPYLLTQALLPLLEVRRGQIAVLISSIWGHVRPETAAYAGSKYALKAFTDVLRAEVNPNGLRVLSLYPGRTATPMQAEVFRAEGREYHPELLLQPADIATALIAALALPRTAELTDIHIRPARKS
jgi:NAD(P)-dependent dehydrogenase (short-subunit alcohol dehydrogenase family)